MDTAQALRDLIASGTLDSANLVLVRAALAIVDALDRLTAATEANS